MRGQKWTIAQHAKYRKTMKAKRDAAKAKPIDAVDVSFPLPTTAPYGWEKVVDLNRALDIAFHSLSIADKLDALARVMSNKRAIE